MRTQLSFTLFMLV